MSQALITQRDCCVPCDSIPITQVPGPEGPPGDDGTDGTDGDNAFSITQAGFTMPAVSGTVSVEVDSSAWFAIGQWVYVQSAGFFTVDSVPDATHVVLNNLGYDGNAAPATIIATTQKVSPAGIKGADGSAPSVTLNDLSPTTSKGDLLVDSGANNPDADVARFAVGTNGQLPVAASAQPLGLQWQTLLPNAATDNLVPRFDASGSVTPTPLQDSGVQITDTGAVQTVDGNARGTDAVDLQPSRSVATQVASGNNATISGGKDNTASGVECVIGGGNGNTATGFESVIGGGASNVASDDRATVGGGNSNQATGEASTIGGGSSNQATDSVATVAGGNGSFATAFASTVGGGAQNLASGSYSVVPGGLEATADKFGQLSHASGSFAAVGDAQTFELMWRIRTTDATVDVEMFLDGVGGTQRASVPTSSSWVFRILLVGRSDAGVDAAWSAEGLIHNNAGATAIVAGPITPVVIADGTGTTWGVAANFSVTADNANDALKLAVTGAGATNIRWVATARVVEVSYPP